MSLRWLIWSLASPSQLILLCLLVGAFFIAIRRFRVGKVLTVIGGAGLFACGVLPTGAYLAYAIESRFPQPQLPPRITGIVLLSGAERPAISEYYDVPIVGQHGQRYLTTLRLTVAHPEARIVYTGGSRTEPGKGPLETQTAVAERLLASVGVDPGRLSFETASRDTCNNAANTRKLVDPQPGETWVVVTSAIHMPRTIACFRAAGWPEIIAQPADYVSTVGGLDLGSFQIRDNLDHFDVAAHEWLGLAWYRLSGRTQEFFPAPTVLAGS